MTYIFVWVYLYSCCQSPTIDPAFTKDVEKSKKLYKKLKKLLEDSAKKEDEEDAKVIYLNAHAQAHAQTLHTHVGVGVGVGAGVGVGVEVVCL